MKHPIPIKRAEDVLHMYFVLLKALESRVDNVSHEGLARHAIIHAYNVLNDIGYTKERPAWERRAKQNPRSVGPVEFENADVGEEG